MNSPHPIPLVSVVTPSFNQGQYLAQTIESVLSQEGDFALDYLIMDGGSTDDSVQILRDYERRLLAGEWPVRCREIRLRWTSEKDRGQTDALQKGFDRAQGEILAWLNSDDFYLPGALQQAVSFLGTHPETALVYGAAHYCDQAGTLVGRYRTAPFDYLSLASFNFICQPSAFFRRDAFLAVGGLNTSLHFAMDYDLWIRLGRRFGCSYLPEFLSVYRLHEESKTIRDETLQRNIDEGLGVVLKHYNWAPVTRVYPSCQLRCKAKLPALLAKRRALLIAAALACTALRSLILNRGIRWADLRLLTRDNLGKLFKSRSEVMLSYGAKDP